MPSPKASTRVVRKSVAPKPVLFNKTAFVAKAKQFLTLRHEVGQIEKQMEALKKDLKATVETEGVRDDKGHYWMDLPESVLGYAALKAERRESVRLNEDAAARILAAKGLVKECSHTYLQINNPDKILAYLKKNAPQLLAEVTDTVVEYDQDAILAAHYDGKLDESEVDEIVARKVSYAFVPAKERGVA